MRHRRQAHHELKPHQELLPCQRSRKSILSHFCATLSHNWDAKLCGLLGSSYVEVHCSVCLFLFISGFTSGWNWGLLLDEYVSFGGCHKWYQEVLFNRIWLMVFYWSWYCSVICFFVVQFGIVCISVLNVHAHAKCLEFYAAHFTLLFLLQLEHISISIIMLDVLRRLDMF